MPWYGFSALCANVASGFAGAPSAPQLSRLTLAAIEAAVIVAPLALALHAGRARLRRHAGAAGPLAGAAQPEAARRS